MTTDENILEGMLDRVTNPDRDNVDNLAVQMFCMIVQSNIDLVSKAHELIVKKMHSSNTTEAAKAIGLLEECMSKAGLQFQKKTAKFTFLNELIALVLDKHDGPPAPVETKKRVMDCLMLWTVEHQDESKIQQAYENLRKQVKFEHDSSTSSTNSSALSNPRVERSSIFGKDEEVVAKLLKQGGAENYRKANLLIQHRVNQEARRTEFICHLKSELKKIESTMEVFEEMLNAYSTDSLEADNRDIILELYNTCKKHNEQMARWPDFLGDGEPEFLEDVLNTRDLLMVALQSYKEIFENEKLYPTPVDSNTSKTNTDLLSEFLGNAITTSTQETTLIKPKSPIKANDTLNELNEIFSSIVDKDEVSKSHHPSDLLNNLDLLKPENVFGTKLKDMPVATVSTTLAVNEKEQKKLQAFKELKEIDKLSEEMFKQNLKEEQRLQSFKKENEKLTLNDMAKDKMQISLSASQDLEKLIKTALKPKEENNKLKIFENLTPNVKDLTEIKQDLTEKTSFQEKDKKVAKSDLEVDKSTEHSKSLRVKPLAEISIDLDEVTPLDEGQRLLLDDDDIQVTLYFTADRPSEHVSVIVMSVFNKSKLPVKDFQFEASVKKPCKVRLLPPTDVAMEPRKPFRPPTPINQVVLLLNPTQKPVDVSCIIGYKLGEDPDPIKELIVTKDIPYV